jgi:hypothetical protein
MLGYVGANAFLGWTKIMANMYEKHMYAQDSHEVFKFSFCLSF